MSKQTRPPITFEALQAYLIRAIKRDALKPLSESEHAQLEQDKTRFGEHWHGLPHNKLRSALSEVENIGYASEYAEQGYSDPERGILFANWNHIPKRTMAALERMGFECEWSDEWDTCSDCNKAVRTSPDSYGWQAYFVLLNDCELVCLDCVDWEDYLASIQDNPNKAVMSACDPSQHGYRLVSTPAQFENGFHAGMNDNPKAILKHYHTQGKTELVFRIPETSQFYITFEVWQHIRTVEDWIPCDCCGYREHVDVCLMDGTSEREFERAFKCGDCSECASPCREVR